MEEPDKGKVYATSRIAFMNNYFIVSLLVTLLALLYIQFNLTLNFFPKTFDQMVSSLIILGVLVVISALIEEPVWRRMLHHYILTDKEITYKSGLIVKKSVSMPFQSIADVKIEKGVMGRIFNFGNVVVNGFKDNMVVNGIRNPEELYEQLRVKISKASKPIYTR